MVDIKKDDDLARHSPTLADPHLPSPTLAHPRSPSPTLAPRLTSATLSTLATLAYTLHLEETQTGKAAALKSVKGMCRTSVRYDVITLSRRKDYNTAKY